VDNVDPTSSRQGELDADGEGKKVGGPHATLMGTEPEHGWAKDRADPHERERAVEIATQEPPTGLIRTGLSPRSYRPRHSVPASPSNERLTLGVQPRKIEL
jgi:hypothetical protein